MREKGERLQWSSSSHGLCCVGVSPWGRVHILLIFFFFPVLILMVLNGRKKILLGGQMNSLMLHSNPLGESACFQFVYRLTLQFTTHFNSNNCI